MWITKNVSKLQLNTLVMSNAGKNLRYLRKLRGWTQEEFANKLKIKRSLVGAYEEERAEPRLEVMELICNTFKLSLEDFLFKDLSAPKTLSYLEKRRQMKMVSEVAEVRFVPVKAAAGYLAGYGDPEFVDESYAQMSLEGLLNGILTHSPGNQLIFADLFFCGCFLHAG